MKNYMEGIGLKITNAKKQEVDKEFEKISDVSFLKERFDGTPNSVK